jgi:hypothetical protein
MGTRVQPYCLLQQAVDDPGSKDIALVAGSCTYGSASIVNRHLTILGRGAVLRIPSMATGIDVQGATAFLDLRNLEITTINNDSHDGISAHDGAILRMDGVIVHDITNKAAAGIAAAGGTLAIRRSLIFLNAGWGLTIQDCNYVVENSFIVANGSTIGTPLSGTGGVRLLGASMGAFVYNTVARNQFEPLTGGPNGAGVDCEVANAPPPVLTDSLILENQVTTAVVNDATTQCQLDHSLTTQMVLPQTATDVFFDPSHPQDTTVKGGGFHVRPAATSVVGKGLPQASPTIDFDGDPRPAPPQMTTPGADEP